MISIADADVILRNIGNISIIKSYFELLAFSFHLLHVWELVLYHHSALASQEHHFFC
jgi:hypothetical protein